MKQVFSKALILGLAFLIFSNYSFSQESLLYKQNVLIADSSFIISNEVVEIWEEIELEILTNLHNFFEPHVMVSDAGLNFSAIFSLQFNKKNNSFYNIKLEKYIANNLANLENIKGAIEDSITSAINCEISWSTRYLLKEKYKARYKFYFPFALIFKPARTFINEGGVFIIEKTERPLVDLDGKSR